MSYSMVEPVSVTASACSILDIGTTVNAAHGAALAATTRIAPAAADEVSQGIAGIMSAFGSNAQAAARQAAALNDSFVQHLRRAADSYATAEAASRATLASTLPSTPGVSQPSAATPLGLWYAVTNAIVLAWTLPFALASFPVGTAYATLGTSSLLTTFMTGLLADQIFYAFGVHIPLFIPVF